MPHDPNPNNRFIEQARSAYMGNPKRIARCQDRYGEEHVVIEMVAGQRDGKSVSLGRGVAQGQKLS